MTPPQFERRMEDCSSSSNEPQGVAHAAASRARAQMWSAPPEAFQKGKALLMYRCAR